MTKFNTCDLKALSNIQEKPKVQFTKKTQWKMNIINCLLCFYNKTIWNHKKFSVWEVGIIIWLSMSNSSWLIKPLISSVSFLWLWNPLSTSHCWFINWSVFFSKLQFFFFPHYSIRNVNILLNFPHKQPSPQLPSPKPSKKNHRNTQLKSRNKMYNSGRQIAHYYY